MTADRPAADPPARLPDEPGGALDAPLRLSGWRSRRVQLIALGVCAAAVAAAAVVAFTRGNGHTTTAPPARLDDAAAVGAYLGAGTSAVAVVTSYDYRHLDDALAAGLAATTGSYQRSYRSAFAAMRVGAVNEHVVQTFDQLRIGIGDVSDDGNQARLLVFGTERRTSLGGNTAQDVTLCVTLVRHGDTYRVSNLTEDENAGLPPGSAGLRAAAEAGRSEVIAVNSYRRAQFGDDLTRALDGAAGRLREQVREGAAATRAAMNEGHYDLSGVVTAVAVERATSNAVTLLMAATGIKIAADGARSSLNSVRFEVTVERTKSAWLATGLTPIRGAA